jgi:hypothetical protein
MNQKLYFCFFTMFLLFFLGVSEIGNAERYLENASLDSANGNVTGLIAKEQIIVEDLPSRFLDKRGYFLLPPLANHPQPMILVILPGAQKRPLEYAQLAEEIQRRSKISLWIGIAKFTGNIPNPMEAKGAVNSLIASLKKEGVTSASLENTFLAGHSMGGIIGQKMVEKESYRGLLLFSSYLTRKNGTSALISFPKPVLTVSGDLDGLTRVTRISVDREAWDDLADKEGDNEAASSKPVLVLRGVNHSQFASELLVKGDLTPEISYRSAQDNIAQISADFILANRTPTSSDHFASDKVRNELGDESTEKAREEAVERLLREQKATKDLLSNFESSRKDQTLWCEQAQQSLSSLTTPGAKIRVIRNVISEKRLFDLSSPQSRLANDGNLEVTIPTWEGKKSNPLDLSLVAEASPDIACKLYTPLETVPSRGDIRSNASEKVRENFLREESGSNSDRESLDYFCSSMNRAMYDQVWDQMPEVFKTRFSRRGKNLVMDKDLSVPSESRWQSSNLGFSQDHRDLYSYSVQSPAWRIFEEKSELDWEGYSERYSEGMLQHPNTSMNQGLRLNCKLLSPSRIAEWIMVDGLKD